MINTLKKLDDMVLAFNKVGIQEAIVIGNVLPEVILQINDSCKITWALVEKVESISKGMTSIAIAGVTIHFQPLKQSALTNTHVHTKVN